ncbi:hypothetical protein GCM10020256_37070 [Streptomyces thermocoprophilus]
MNPVPAKPVVELIPGVHTSPETVRRTRELLTAMGKKAVEVKDSAGFVSNRVLMLTVNEAAYLVYEGWRAPPTSTRCSAAASGTPWARWRRPT